MNQKTSIRTFFHSKGFVEFLHIALEDKWLYVIIIGIRIIEVLLSLGWAELNRRLFNEITSLSIRLCITIVGLFILIKCLNIITNYFRSWLESLLNERVVTRMRWAVLRKATYLKYSFYEENHIARVYKVFFTDLESVKDLLVSYIPDLVCIPLNFIGIGVYLFMINPLLTIIAIAIGPIQILCNRYKLQEFKDIVKKLNNFDYRYFLMMEETVQGIREIKENMLEEDTLTQFDTLCKKGVELDVKKVRVETSRRLVRNMPQDVAYIVGISIVFFLMFQGKIELGAFVVFTSLLTAVSDSFNKIVNVISKVYEAISNTEDLREIMELEEEDILDGEELTEGPASIEFKNVSFMYANGNKILNDISFQVPKGSTVAIVGPSGGGKTTITKLLQRFYKPLDGSILVNDKPIDVYALGKLRQKIAVVPQDLFLYAMSIKDNICIGKLDATLDEVKECAKMADIATFIESLPDQYNTEVGERGVKLSQGQRQRIAIARALIKNASLIILDEATSALDVETENNFQVNFNKLSKNCTKIVIAHRLATVKDADYIAFVDRGKVVEYGTLEELVNLRSRFYEYWNKQINIDVK